MAGWQKPGSISERLGFSEPLLCSWLMMPGRFQAGLIAKAGKTGERAIEAVLLDMQHGMISYGDMVEMIETVSNAGSFALVRPPLNDFAMVSRALDVGAAGIVCPMINTRHDAEKLVAAAKFPPVGGRSWGAYLGQSMLGMDKETYLARANGHNAIFAMIETRQALENLDEICAVDGIDGVFVGPNDLCISLTEGQAADVSHESVQAALPKILNAAKLAGKSAGIYCATSEQVKSFGKMGFSLMPALSDVSFISQSVENITRQVP